MIDFAKVGQKIIWYRKQASMTQDELASKLFVTRQALSKWELGTGIPSVDSLLGLCNIFRISFEEILCLNETSSLITLDSEDIFKGKDRTYVLQLLVHQQLKVHIPDILYQCSPYERMVLLRAIKGGQIEVKMSDLLPKLTLSEQTFINEKFPKGGKKK